MSVKWRVVVFRLSGAPSRARVGVWRELRRLGAVSLGQSAWLLPASSALDEGLHRATQLAEAGGGDGLVLDVVGDAGAAPKLERIYNEAREAEWAEFIVECDRYLAEIAKEFAKAKFTAAELDEEEQSLERLRRWYRAIRLRDVLGTEPSADAHRRLRECDVALETYATKVYEALHR